MVYTLSYQMYKCEHGLGAAEQRAADMRGGEAAGAMRELGLRLGRAFGARNRGLSVRGVAGSGGSSMRLLSSGR